MNTYELVDYEPHGEYKGHYPSQAASKAFTKLSKHFDLSNSELTKKYLLFTIKNKETNKIYTYLGARIKLYKPIKVNNRFYYHKNLILPKPKCIDLKEVNKNSTLSI